jgi:hypothetical protein
MTYDTEFAEQSTRCAPSHVKANFILSGTYWCSTNDEFHHRRGPVTIVSVKAANKCLDVRGAAFTNGTPVQMYASSKPSGPFVNSEDYIKILAPIPQLRLQRHKRAEICLPQRLWPYPRFWNQLLP